MGDRVPEHGDAVREGQRAWLERYDKALAHTFGTPQRVFVRGEGTHVWDADGQRYTDFLSGLAVTALGHGHPAVSAAITAQLATLGHVSNFFATPGQIELAERLGGFVTAGDPRTEARVFFCQSGTEANECAFKTTRLTGRTRVVAMTGAFHGRTMGALALTANPAYREPFAPLPGEVEFVPYGDADALAAAVDTRTAAVVLEPLQGENGVVDPGDDFLRAARAITAEHGALLWIDEVQTGLGRCGDWLASASSGVTADLVTFAKGLGNGFPIGACVAAGPAAHLLQPGHHGSTFAGNPVAAAAGLAVIAVSDREGLLARARERGEQLRAAVEELEHPLIAQVRGRGLLRGIVLTEDAAAGTVARLLDAGWIVNAPRPGVIRVAPPLIVSEAQIAGFAAALAAALPAGGRR